MSRVLRYVQGVKDSIRFMSRSDRLRAYYAFTGVASLTAAGSYAAAHTIFLDDYVIRLRMYKQRMALPVPSWAIDLLNETIDDLNLQFPHSEVGIFNFVGSDIYSIGSLTLPTGSYIGIPYSFNYEDVGEIKRGDLRFLGQYRTKQPTSSPEVRKLAESLVLSKQAKKYVFAHELCHLQSSFIYVKAFSILTFSLASLLAVPNIRAGLDRLGGRASNKYVKAAACAFGFVSFALGGWLADELIDQTYDVRALNQALTAAGGREDYALGAVEYYGKMIKRNEAIFSLLKQHGPRFFGPDGSTKHWAFGLLHKSFHSHLKLSKIYLKDLQHSKGSQIYRMSYK